MKTIVFLAALALSGCISPSDRTTPTPTDNASTRTLPTERPDPVRTGRWDNGDGTHGAVAVNTGDR